MNFRRLLPVIAAMCLAASLDAEVDKEVAGKLLAPMAKLEDFTKAVEEAAKAGAPAQFIAEAKLVWGLRNKDAEYLAKIIPDLEAAAKNFKREDAVAMESAEMFQALVSYIRALEAAGKGDEAGLKQHITEAFWLSPVQAELFAETILFFRTQEKMSKITLEMNAPLTTSKAEPTSLRDVLGGNKAVLLAFWASWSVPCMELMPELRRMAEYLGKQGIAVAGINTEAEEAIAEKVRAEKGMNEVVWLVEPKSKPYSQPLEIRCPQMILVSPEGKVLFHGHPLEPGLWVALKKLDPKITPPANPQ